MAPAFSKEAIISGSIDHLCLVCEKYLKTDREVYQHVSTLAHCRSLDATDYVEKYRHDRVRKVKKWYFCEFCNTMMATITKVSLHVQESGHMENIASQVISRQTDFVMSEKTAIREAAWHGLIDENTCVICNVEFEDKDRHRSESDHIINLIQSRVYNVFNNIYRKIDESTFHCLTCNKVVVEIQAHLNDTQHINRLQTCTINIPPNLHNDVCKKEIFEGDSLLQTVIEMDVLGQKNMEACNTSKKTEISDKNGNMETNNMVKIEEHINDELNNNKHISNLNGKFMCNLCNCDIDSLKVESHLHDLCHQNMLKMLQEGSQKSAMCGETDENLSATVNSITEFQKANININLETRTAVCKKCSVNLEFNYNIIYKHIEDHKNEQKITTRTTENLTHDKDKTGKTEDNNKKKSEINSMKVTKESDDDIIKRLAKEHDLTHMSTSKKLHCEKCNKSIPLAIKNIHEHVNGQLHMTNTQLFNKSVDLKDNELLNKTVDLKGNENKKTNVKKINLQKVPLQQFIRNVATMEGNMIFEDIVVNEKYCINKFTFIFLTKTSEVRLRCQVCEVNITFQDLHVHLQVERHVKALEEVLVIVNMDTEFIREIRSDKMQCGYCNAYYSWDAMQNHLKSIEHKESKNFANWRLSQLLPQIQRHRFERQIQNELMSLLAFRE